VGGGAVYFHLEPKIGKGIINDSNAELINFYIELSYNFKDLIETVKSIPNNKEYFNKIRKFKPETSFEYAVRYLYLNKTAYSGLMRYNSKGEFNTPYGNYKNPNFEITQEQIDLVKSAEIHNCDFRKIPITYKLNDFIFVIHPMWKLGKDIISYSLLIKIKKNYISGF